MKLFSRSLLTILAFLFLFGCATKMSTMPSFDTKSLDADNYTAKVDNFIVLFDASSSMARPYNDARKFDIARAVVNGMNETLPELGQTAGLRSFGHDATVSAEETQLFYGMEKYNTKNLTDSFAKITKPGGTSSLYLAIDEAGEDLNGLSGDMNAVIIVSDGKDLPGDILASSRKLKERYGDSICFFPILVGDDKKGMALLQEIADIGGCGFFSKAGELMTYAGMTEFVEMVFLNEKFEEPKPALKPAPPKVEVKKDSDGDGVYDDEDQCPGTPIGAKVNAVGCWALDNVLFDFDKDEIKPMAFSQLNDVVEILEKNPGMSIDLNGHCDNVGTAEYNMDLSMRRALAVKNYLVGKGIAAGRLATKGFGFTKPIALNGTDEGRAMNRRVELHPY